MFETCLSEWVACSIRDFSLAEDLSSPPPSRRPSLAPSVLIATLPPSVSRRGFFSVPLKLLETAFFNGYGWFLMGEALRLSDRSEFLRLNSLGNPTYTSTSVLDWMVA